MSYIPNYGYTQSPKISQNPFFYSQNPGIIPNPTILPTLGEQLGMYGINTPVTQPPQGQWQLRQPTETGTGLRLPLANNNGYLNVGSNNSATSTSTSTSTPATAPDGTILGLNQNQIGMIGGLASGLASLGGAYSAFKGVKLANKQFNYNRGMMDAQFANSIEDYNRRLSDVARSRGDYYGGTMSDPNKIYESDYTRRWEAKDRRKK